MTATKVMGAVAIHGCGLGHLGMSPGGCVIVPPHLDHEDEAAIRKTLLCVSHAGSRFRSRPLVS